MSEHLVLRSRLGGLVRTRTVNIAQVEEIRRAMTDALINDPLTADMVRRYAAGDSIRTIANDVGRSYTAVHERLARAGVTFRPVGARKRSPVPGFSVPGSG